MKNPRVLMISGDFPPALSGVGDYTLRLCDEMSSSGAEVTVLTTKTAACGAANQRFCVRAEMPDWSFKSRNKVLDLATSGDFDVVHMQYPAVKYGRGPAVNLLPMFLSSRRDAPPCVLTIHDFRVMRMRWRARVAPMLAFASALIHVDGGDGPYLRRWSPLRHAPMKCIPIASNAPVLPCDDSIRAQWRRDLGLSDDELAVAYFGILYPHKGTSELLDAIDALHAEGIKLRPIIIGDFDRDADYVATMTARFTTSSNGNKPPIWVRGASLERVSECLHASDLAALPFHSGASFNRSSMLACLQHGLPTITTDGPATPADLAEAFDLVLVPPKDVAQLRDALRSVATSAALRSTMRANSLRQTESLSWPGVAKQHLDFYREILAIKPREAARVA